MRRLILFRHAKTEARLAGQDDRDRPLTERGRADAELMGRMAAERGLVPDLVLLSPSRRTLETWQYAGAHLPGAAKEVHEAIYDATADELAAELDGARDRADTVMIIGHNPGLQELAVNLLIESGAGACDVERLAARFPTSTLAVFQIDADGKAGFDGVFYPRDVSGPRD
jgi:phosphohistidine phosphatase